MKKGSETKIIKRSQINLNPCNPKVHTDADIKQQKANIKKVGLIGGIQWHETTGNLIDGHKRVMSVDLIQGYDGTPETDYDIKVEAVDFDEKTEKEQLLFMAKSQDPIDYNLVAKNFSIDEIDFKAAGFTEQDTEQIKMLQDDLEASLKDSGMDDFSEDFLNEPIISVTTPTPMTELPNIEKTSEEIVAEHAAKPKMTKEEVKEQKLHCTDVGKKRKEDIDNFIFIDFESFEQKRLFCEMLQMEATNSMRISGSQILSLL